MKTPSILGGKHIRGPFTIPSGIIGTEVSVLKKIADDIPQIGILTTKSIGLEPRKGNCEPILARYSRGTFTNAVGLTNPGADEFAKRLEGVRFPNDVFLLISIFGSSEDEFESVAKKLFAYADGFELNMSCPHSSTFGQVIGADTALLERVTRRIAALGKPTFVKISPNLDCAASVAGALRGGASGIVAVNTKGPEKICHNGLPVLSNTVGGISGAELLETGIHTVAAVRRMTDLPIIACGGIATANDVRRYRETGASFFGIGSALGGLSTEQIQTYFACLATDTEQNTNTTTGFLVEPDMQYRAFHVKECVRYAHDLCELFFEEPIAARPGQFVFAWLPGIGEKPFSVFNDEPMSLLVQTFGVVTSALSKLNAGDTIYIRGPYGRSPIMNGNALLVGGGTGIAALYLFAKNNSSCTAVLGAKDGNHLPYQKFERVCKKLYLRTDNGELGEKGFVTHNLGTVIADCGSSMALNCGPQVMIHAAIGIEKKSLPPDRIYSSIDFLTKCGVGICGSCATSKGVRSCVDGTFLLPHQI